ncbi:MAG: hypothetical protein D6693_06155 [Planctomycetota bacterium]|nr:MAG: hypothetical protein D6693_06155 [Planctomycetota bacterium]
MPEFSDHDALADPLEGLDPRDADAACRLLEEAATANREASCRAGSVDLIEPRGVLIATGDLHDNPLHFARVLRLARLTDATPPAPRHVTLHEVIHGVAPAGVDLSHRALLRVAAVKRRYPEQAHTLLANHELAQIVGAGIVKDGVRVVDAFNEGVERVFGDAAGRVLRAIGTFIRSMPLALIARLGDGRGVLCAHSLPSPGVMGRFDPGVLERDLTEADYEPRTGSAHLMVWGRGQTPEQLGVLAERWGVSLFVLGHQHAEAGWDLLPPNGLILNSDHARGVVATVDLADPPAPADLAAALIPIGQSV